MTRTIDSKEAKLKSTERETESTREGDTFDMIQPDESAKSR